MGSSGYRVAAGLPYRADDVILEVGADRDEGSTPWLAQLGPPVVTVDVDPAICERVARIPRVQVLQGLAEEVLVGWSRPIRFAWLDGHDWPYEGPEYPPGCWAEQQRQYHLRNQGYSMLASQDSHLRVAELIAGSVVPGGLVAFDDTWPVEWGWDGKGGSAVPYLLGLGAFVLGPNLGDQLVLLRRMS